MLQLQGNVVLSIMDTNLNIMLWLWGVVNMYHAVSFEGVVNM